MMFVMSSLIEKSNMITIAEKQANKSDREKEKKTSNAQATWNAKIVWLLPPVVGLYHFVVITFSLLILMTFVLRLRRASAAK